MNMQRIGLMVCWVLILSTFLRPSATAAQTPDHSVREQRAPDTFRAIFKTTKGDFIIEAYRKWSPLGVDRLYHLIKTGFYNNTVFFRVQQDYVIQFGISDDSALNRFWDRRKLRDEPIQQKHSRGIIAYARDFANSRTTQLFINTVDNPKLDTIVRAGLRGYTPIARIIKGMNITAKFNDRYGRTTLAIQDSIYLHGNKYLDRHFPGLDRIISAVPIR